jgi:glycerol transport system ATP-binding protein
LPDGPVTIGLRPHDLRVGGRAGGAHGSAGDDDLTFGGDLLLAELTGSATLLHLDVGDGPPLVAEIPGVHRHPLGEHLELRIDPRALLAFDAADGRTLAHPGLAVAGG